MIKRTYSVKWFERFGNNIQQISNGIIYCQKNQNCFISPDHNLISSFKINHELETNNIVYNKFFNSWDFGGCSQWNAYNNIRHEIIKTIIYPKLKFLSHLKEPLNANDLVIHIRSGDIFTKTHKRCDKFVQNPLSFFLKIIELYDNIYICSENNNNPVLEYLAKLQNVTIYTNRSIIEDLSLIMRSQNVCIGGIGTFAIAACMLSQNLKNFYSTDLDPVTFLNYNMINAKIVNKHIYHIDQNKYIRIGTWKNTKEQRNLMINYKP